MIDLSKEALLSLTQAAKTLPRRRAGKRPHVSCLYRWAKTGCRGVILETVQVGGTKCTFKEALARFFERLTYGGDHPTRCTPSQRQHAAAEAERELAREGL